MKKFGRTAQQGLALSLILLPILVVICLVNLTANTSSHSDIELPKIQGVILKDAQPLINLQLTDHLGKTVNRDYFIGKWHVITYGYTHCPDICPTTLFILTQLADLLSRSNDNPGSQFVFYTIDPQRDSQAILAQYIAHFSAQFIAMRAKTYLAAEYFQTSLGIKAEITRTFLNDGDEPMYQVSHGLTILLINPEAELQAVLSPEITAQGINSFTAKRLYSDYMKVIKYYQQRQLLDK